MHSPIEQFQIKPLIALHVGGHDLAFSNSSLWMVVALLVLMAFFVAATAKAAVVPGRLQSTAELAYEFIAGMVRDNVGEAGKPFFPFVFTIFTFILAGNLLGMVPYSFTFTSHIIVTFSLAIVTFLGVTLVGLVLHGLHFFSFFVPKGVPVFMLPLMVVIEVLSYLTRPISLSVRLFANMMAGHTMLKVFASFTIMLGIFGVAPIAINVALTGFEILVALLQAYVFAVLTCIYLNDAIHLH
ncbi:MAG: F0F1 ATP synthase subunit A [Proteobacteria bacterium]|nr:F0F1 ATP synthase subunit A [Pseudomonadota bacterium]MBI3498300.1 F0F1 ATP synthase subunit A [Pseudomonadota bacterium]